MKAKEAPEKIYLQEPTKVRTEKKYDNDVEYIRTDAFIEKACQWIAKNYINYAHNTLGKEALAQDFRNAMKGE